MVGDDLEAMVKTLQRFPGGDVLGKRIAEKMKSDMAAMMAEVKGHVAEFEQWLERSTDAMKGYWEKPEATAKRLRPGLLPGGQVLYTGDYCRLDEEGYLYFVGRMDDIIKTRGEKVSPKEVENVLMSISGVREAAVIGVPDAILGQAVKAFVVLDADAVLSEKAIQLECQALLENFMVPRDVAIVSALPRTTSGKTSKLGLA